MTEPAPDPNTELGAIADKLLDAVSTLYQYNPGVAAADKDIRQRLRRSQWLLTPWLDSMNYFGNGLEVLQEDGRDKTN